MSDHRLEHRKWIAPPSGGYSGLSRDGRVVPRPPSPPTTPATVVRSTDVESHDRPPAR